MLKPFTSEWSERDQRQELLGCRLYALSSAEPAQLNDQQFARVPRIELRESRADQASVRLAECHSAEGRRVDVDARHAPLAFAVGREPAIGGTRWVRRCGGDDLIYDG